jgi:hypothetical protein
MTSQGTTAGQLNKALDQALRSGDLRMAIATARDLGRVDLGRATRILVLMGREQSSSYARAAARWLSRYAAEKRDVTPEQLADAADALAELKHGDPDAGERLLAAVKGTA